MTEMGFGKRSVEIAYKALMSTASSSVTSSASATCEALVGWLLEHQEVAMAEWTSGEDSDGSLSSIGVGAFDESDSITGDSFDDLEDAFQEALSAEAAPSYKSRADFSSSDEYAAYVRDNLQVGMTVRCCRSFEEVEEGDLGRVIKHDRDGLQELNVQADWERKAGPYWLKYGCIEIVGFEYPSRVASSIAAAAAAAAAARSTTSSSDPGSQSLVRVGDRVRVKESVKIPKYKWGSVSHGAVGVVKTISPNGQDLTIDFPQVCAYSMDRYSQICVCSAKLYLHFYSIFTFLCSAIPLDWTSE